MGAHQTTFEAGADHLLDVRVLRFRMSPEREEPTLLALELVGAGRTHDAIEVVDGALAADPEDVDLLLGCGVAAVRGGQLAFAQLVLTRAAKLDPAWGEPLRWLAKVLAMRGREDKAVAVARRALAAGEDDAELVAMVRRDDRRRALDARLASYADDPDTEEPALLAQALLEETREAEALAVVRGALARDPRDSDLHVLEARALLARREREAAKDALARAIEHAPAWGEPARMLADLLADEGALIDALRVVERALAHDREDEALIACRVRVEDAMRAAGIERPERVEAGLDDLLSTLDRIDPIGDETRRGFARCDTAVDLAAPVLERPRRRPLLAHAASASHPDRRRKGWLPSLQRRLFGASARAPGVGGEDAPRRPVASA